MLGVRSAREERAPGRFLATHTSPHTHTHRYRNGVKALPWHASVRRLLEDKAQWGLFMPIAGCMPSPGVYVCGVNASDNLYHDFEETPQARTFRCGVGIECGEYVFNHRNASLRDFFLGEYFFPTPFPKSVTGCAFGGT